jgi:hypothetical protein
MGLWVENWNDLVIVRDALRAYAPESTATDQVRRELLAQVEGELALREEAWPLG